MDWLRKLWHDLTTTKTDTGTDAAQAISGCRSVDEVNITGWTASGLTAPFPMYTLMLEIKWTDAQGVKRTHGPQTYTFPNDLAAMPLAVRRNFANQMIVAAARVALGIDSWEKYE